MKELTLREIQLVQFEVLKRLRDICDQLNIKFYIFYGTLLGAVRHKGFIPWDDDIDVVMYREDFEVLVDYCNKHMDDLHPFRLHHYSNNKKYIYPIARFSDSRYFVDYNNAEDYDLGLFVDIYPFDGCGNSIEEATKIAKRQRRLIVPICYGGLKKFTPSVTGGVRTLFKFFVYHVVRIIGVHRFVKWADNNAKKYQIRDSVYIENTSWDLEKYKMLKVEDFGEGEYIEFEGELFCAPKNWDKILKAYYKDYMQLPPENDRVGHHYYKAFLKNQ